MANTLQCKMLNLGLPGIILMASLLTTTAGGLANSSGVSNTQSAQANTDYTHALEDYATPGPLQAELEQRAGRWNVECTEWASEGATPSTSTGTAEFKMTMGGRFLEQQYQTEGDGRKVVGWGLAGHNNITKQFQFTWVDNWGTGMLQGTGQADGGTIVWSATFTDPLTGLMQLRMEETTKGDDQFSVTMYGIVGDQSEYKMREIIYRRQQEDAVDSE